MNEYNIINKIDNYISYIIKYNTSLKLDSLFDFVNNSSNNYDILFEKLLNYYMYSISKDFNNNMYSKMKDIISFIYKNNIKINSKLIVDEASIIADDLLQKITSYNKRNITLPIKINILKEYSISSIIKNKYLNKVIILLIIKLAIINYFINIC